MKQVLIIEDDNWLADSYRRVLEKVGFEVAVIRYAEVAVDMLEIKRPDVILADMLLDTNTVLPLLHELQTYDDTKNIPVVICTALDSPGLDVNSMHGYGVVSVLNKTTLLPEQLVMSIKEAIV